MLDTSAYLSTSYRLLAGGRRRQCGNGDITGDEPGQCGLSYVVLLLGFARRPVREWSTGALRPPYTRIGPALRRAADGIVPRRTAPQSRPVGSGDPTYRYACSCRSPRITCNNSGKLFLHLLDFVFLSLYHSLVHRPPKEDVARCALPRRAVVSPQRGSQTQEEYRCWHINCCPPPKKNRLLA